MTTKTLFSVLGLDGTSYSAAFQTERAHATDWARLLGQWHGAKRGAANSVQCQCRPAQSIPLVLRQYETGKFTLARYPGSGPQHDSTCRYFGPSISGAISNAYVDGVVKEDDGIYTVRLATGRSMQEALINTECVEPRPGQGPGVSKQRAMTTLGLMQLLWEIAGLHEYRPAWKETRANSPTVASLLLNAAADVRWGQAELRDSLQVASTARNGGLSKHNKDVAANAIKDRTRLVVIGRLKKYKAGTQASAVDLAASLRVPIEGVDCANPYLSKVQAQSLHHSFQRELSAWRTGATTYVALIVEPEAGQSYFNLVRIALMHVSPRAIPLDSSYEAQVEDALAGQNRTFVKPIRHVDGDATLPDFQLLDAGSSPLPMEVFGLNTPAYQTRMKEKEIYYNQQPNPPGWWRWDAFNGSPMPAFPARAQNP
ncbi:DUF1173 family protein [Stenotrophomonas maltophilia]|nr:DUF1173 family protein [Stenotrophomonas maltophilia]